MKVKLTEDFEYSPDGREVVVASAGEILEGDYAQWALAQGKAAPVAAAKTPPANKAKKPPQNKAR